MIKGTESVGIVEERSGFGEVATGNWEKSGREDYKGSKKIFFNGTIKKH